MLRKILQVQRRVLGEAHPDTLNTGNSLASSLVVQNRYEEAEAIHKSVIATALQKLGPSDPNTITYLMNYAGGFHVNKRYAEEVEQLLAAWNGAQSPAIPKSMRARIAARLAAAYELLGQTEQATTYHALAEAATRPAAATMPAVARATTSSPS
jgi:hypothetical protein